MSRKGDIRYHNGLRVRMSGKRITLHGGVWDTGVLLEGPREGKECVFPVVDAGKRVLVQE